MSTKRIIVISRQGKLVGTYIPETKRARSNGPRGTVVAGPGQRLHELEVEDPEKYHKRRAIGELHALVKKRLRLK